MLVEDAKIIEEHR